MKKLINVLACLTLFAAVIAVASEVGKYSTGSTSATTGEATVTGIAEYTSARITHAAFEAAAVNSVTMYVYRVVNSGAYTQLVGTVTAAASSKSAAANMTFPNAYLKYGDSLYLTTSPATNCTFIIDSEVARH